jgi:hypothetical protein
MATRKKKAETVAERTDVCKTCRGSHFENEEFTCRRHPPTPVYNAMKGVIKSAHPVVATDHWCVDFAPHLNS